MAVFRNELYVGSKEDPTFYFDNDHIVDADGEMSLSVVGDTLSVDTITFTVVYETSEDDTSSLATLKKGTPVWFSNGGNSVGKFYVKSVTRVAKTQWEIEATSLIGLLDTQTYFGKYFDNVPFRKVVRDIIATNGVNNRFAYDKAHVYGKFYFPISESIMNYFEIHLKGHYYGIGEGASTSGTSDTAYILGSEYYNSTSGVDAKVLLEAALTRSSASAAWNDTLNFYFDYHGQRCGPVTIAPDSDYQIDIVAAPSGGTFKMNGKSFTFTTSDAHTTYALWYLFGACRDGISSDPYWTGCLDMDCSDFTFTKYQYDGTGENVEAVYDDIYWMYYLDETIIYMILSSSNGNISTKAYCSSSATKIIQLSIQRLNALAYLDLSEETQALLDKLVFSDDVLNITVSGWIENGTKRAALQKLLFAENVSLIKGDDDTIIFTYLLNSDPTEIPDGEVYDDGEVEYAEPAKSVSVTEHSYIANKKATTETIYDNSEGSGVSNYAVIFEDAPIIASTIKSSGIRILALNENCAIIGGKGTLTGIPYVHAESVLTKTNEDSIAGDEKTVTSVHLINVSNSESVLNKLYSYYVEHNIVKASIVLKNEKCGGFYKLRNKFNEIVQAFLAKMSIVSSSIIKAECELVSNFTPSGGSGYTHSVLLTGSGTWTVPSEVLAEDTPSIRAVLVGGGQGGSNGYAGEDGTVSTSGYETDIDPTEGGASGENGAGGYIYTVTIEGSNVASSFSYNCGTGGNGAPAGNIYHDSNTAGSDGTATTFGNYTSASGARSESGVHNLFNGNTYGAKPEKSSSYNLSGGNSGYMERGYFRVAAALSDWIKRMRAIINNPEIPESEIDYQRKTTYTPQDKGKHIRVSGGEVAGYFYGGFGGGNACGANGSDGGYAYLSSDGTKVICAPGGNGANATTPGMGAQEVSSTRYGWGGYGGPGGGAGGPSGYGCSPEVPSEESSSPGKGGYGGAGGKGGDGCIIIYY